MLRPLATIVAAILLTRPDMPQEQAERYASIVREEARTRNFDPLTAVAIVHFESGWNPAVVSDNGEDYGLGQVRARFIGACKDDADPLNAPSPECKAVKQSLLDAETNLHTMARLISENKKLCLARAKSAALPRWLASYQGLNFPKQHKWCAPGEKTWKVVKYRSFLESKLVAKRVAQPKSDAKPAPPKAPAKAPAKPNAAKAPAKPAAVKAPAKPSSSHAGAKAAVASKPHPKH